MKKIILLFLFSFFLQIHLSAQQTVGVFVNTENAYNGYTLFSPSSSKLTYLIDNCGFIVNTWESAYFPGNVVYLLEDGNLLRTARIPNNFQGGGTGGRIEIYNWEGDLIWGYNYSTNQYNHHHDVAYLENGNILLIAWESRTNAEMIEAGRNPSFAGDIIWSEKVVELKPIGSDSAEVVWEWFLWDHIVQEFDSSKSNFGVVADHPELLDINFFMAGSPTSGVDWIHFNAINYNAELDQIILSSRHLSEIFVIDHSTTTAEAASHSGGNSGKGGDFLFRWGNPQAYQRGTLADKKLFGQHDAQWIPKGYPDEGKIMVFNNGLARPAGNYSTVDVIEPIIDANGNYIIDPGQPFKPDNLYWTYFASPTGSFYSSNISGANRLPNGNTLICEGRKGKFFEVDITGNIQWEYISPVNGSGPVSQGSNIINNSVFRAYRYGEDFPAFIGKDLTPTVPVEMNPIALPCEIFTNVDQVVKLEGVNILGNPIFDFLKIENKNSSELEIEIVDLTGRVIDFQKTSNQLIEVSSSNWANGIYFVRINDTKQERFFIEKIIKQ